jgi:hypothetical protein
LPKQSFGTIIRYEKERIGLSMEKKLTVVVNGNSGFMQKTFDTLACCGQKYTYLIKDFNKILVDANYHAFKNKLNIILDETKKRLSKDRSPVTVLFNSFDRMCTVADIDKLMNEVFMPFMEDMPVSVHLYVSATTYETCRNRSCLNAITGETKVFVDYEDWRSDVI